MINLTSTIFPTTRMAGLKQLITFTGVLLLSLMSFSTLNACDNIVDPGSITADQTICNGETPALLEGTEATGGSGAIEYLWMQTTDAGPNPTYSTIPGAESRDYQPGALTETTYFLRCVKRSGCINYLETSSVEITVIQTPQAEILNAPASVTLGTPFTFNGRLEGGATYAWTFENGTAPATDVVNPTATFNALGFQEITLTITRTVNGVACSDMVTIQIEVIAALPVELADFKAAVNTRNQVDLSWATLSETNHNYFEIEHSTDGSKYEAIAEILGDGVDSYEAKYYTYSDLAPNKGQNYYRLKQVDEDGSIDYSSIQVVTIDQATTSVTAFPNPVHEELQIHMEQPLQAPAHLYIYHATSGQLLQMLTLPAATVKHQVNTQDLPSGLYLLSVRNAAGDSLLTTKLMKTAR